MDKNFSLQYLNILKMKEQIHDKLNVWRTRKKSEPQMGFEPTTLLDLVGRSNHWATGYITRSAILVSPQTQKFAGGKISGFQRKSFTQQNSPDSKVFGFKVPTFDSGFKISGDMTKPGSFYIGFIHLYVNGKTNPVLKRSGTKTFLLVTNLEQFPLV